MTDNELDNLFKNTFSDHEAPIPGNMWQRIQPGDAKKRPVALWWKWYAAASVILITGLATWWYTDSAGSSISKVTSYNTSNNKENNSTRNKDAGVIQDNHASKQQNNSSDNQQTNTEKFNYNKQQLTLSHTVNENRFHAGKSSLKSSPSISPNTRELNASAINQKPDASSTNKNFNSPAQNQINNSTNLENPQTSSTPVIENNDKSVADDNITKQNTTANINTVASNTKKDNKKAKLPWTFEVFATTAYADKQTYDVVKENPIFGAAPIPPPQPKPSLWNYGAGIRLGIPIANKFTLKTGLQFAQTIQKADYQQQNVVDMISVRGGDTSFYRQIVLETEKQKSTHNSLSVPVLISYQTGKKLHVGATAGVIVNAYSWYSGNVPNADYTTTLNAKDTYKHNTGAALYAGVTIAQKLGTIELFAEPHLQYSISNMTKPTVPFKQKINTYGVSIGIRTSLHK